MPPRPISREPPRRWRERRMRTLDAVHLLLVVMAFTGSPRAVLWLTTRAKVRERLGDVAEAAALLREAYDRANAGLGPEHATTLETAAELERINADLRQEADRLATDNKELHLRMDLIMEENARLKSLLLGYQSREELQRRRQRRGSGSVEVDAQSSSSRNRRFLIGGHGNEVENRPFPFPERIEH